ncbi:Dopamine receptor 2 [Strongyloides ratti]|uniref:Dopamine receptor 2 n=1 Tax=Strongyloides ratti TaxID=34506 RepID=A0A090KRY3_STRRB|nr:Dopamine receptor 2 [Strongyloides ratti]CEF60245.1 Dopamine receptor 2 [Strongyloides ratti]
MSQSKNNSYNDMLLTAMNIINNEDNNIEKHNTFLNSCGKIALTLLLSFFCIMTISGNCLVVLAVCTKKYLRNPTGFLIVSLAIADLIVGLVVMPLNSLFEITNHVWLLGLPMCDLFHAFDILASTSSIWSLCVISLDRYMAGQDPIGYRDKVSKKKILITIGLVWMASACLSFPAIIWWRKASPQLYLDDNKCIFTDNWLYIVFSSLVSFYIPLILILFAYGRVYLIATRHSKSLKLGIKKVKNKKVVAKNSINGGSEEVILNNDDTGLRIHYGGGIKNSSKGVSIQCLSHHSNDTSHPTQYHKFSDVTGCGRINQQSRGEYIYMNKYSSRNLSKSSDLNKFQEITLPISNECRTPTPVGGFINCYKQDPLSQRVTHKTSTISFKECPNKKLGRTSTNKSLINLLSDKEESSVDFHEKAQRKISLRKRLCMKEKSRQMVKYVHEQRAARTLSIVVGVFILCWLPFFILSPILSICQDCVSDKRLIFSIFTWAGHLNSMLNPLIYSRFSRDFRKAFKQILICQKEKPPRSVIKSPLTIMFAKLVTVSTLSDDKEIIMPINQRLNQEMKTSFA